MRSTLERSIAPAFVHGAKYSIESPLLLLPEWMIASRIAAMRSAASVFAKTSLVKMWLGNPFASRCSLNFGHPYRVRRSALEQPQEPVEHAQVLFGVAVRGHIQRTEP